jgi:hypothetical protein
MSAASEQRQTAGTGALPVLLFLFFHALYGLTSSGNAFRIPDEFEVYFQAESLVDAGHLAVPQTLAIRQQKVVNGKVVTEPVFFGKVGTDGRPYAPYGPLAAVLALPHHLAGRALAAAAGIERTPIGKGMAWLVFVGGVTMLASATAAALAVAGFFRAAVALGTPSAPALRLAVLLGGATVLWPYGKTLYSEAWQAAAFVWAAALLLEARGGGAGARLRVIGAAALLAVAGLTKVTSLIFAPAFVLAALTDASRPMRQRIEVAVTLGLGIALSAGLHIAWNVARFGDAFDFGYDWAETVPVLPARAFSLGGVPHGLLTLLFAPGKSLFLWAPVLVLAALGYARFRRREPAVAVGIAAALGVGLAVFAAYLFPEGGYSHGPRNLVPIVPIALLAACGPEAGQWSRRALASCGAVGFVVAMGAISVSFIEDQALGGPGTMQGSAYYDIIDPSPGRASNRYRVDYVPFVTAFTRPGWTEAPGLGQGPDFFPRLLLAARRTLPDRGAIPGWLVWAWPVAWALLLAASGAALARASRSIS